MDPREPKLPKWAQELLEAERIKAAFCWPTMPEPSPDWELDVNAYPIKGERLEHNRHVYSFRTDLRGRGLLFEHWVDDTGHLHPRRGSQGFGARPEGSYYARRDDAALAMWWQTCRDAAKAIYAAKKIYTGF